MRSRVQPLGREAEIDTRASAPNVHEEEDRQWKCGRAETCRMRISLRTLLGVGVAEVGDLARGGCC